MKFSMTRQEKSGLLIQVTAWTGLIVFQSSSLKPLSLKSIEATIG
jgi:hypothetical protein